MMNHLGQLTLMGQTTICCINNVLKNLRTLRICNEFHQKYIYFMEDNGR